jgi:putative ubiquitin-RnfH superfamily antitoxin RatB of RatAB toxin-antitoxin module
MGDTIKVEVIYALPDRQLVIPLQVKKGTSMFDAAVQSGIASRFEGLDLEAAPMGVFGKAERKPRERILEDGERVEIYRPLIADPKDARKKRAAAKEEEKGQ